MLLWRRTGGRTRRTQYTSRGRWIGRSGASQSRCRARSDGIGKQQSTWAYWRYHARIVAAGEVFRFADSEITDCERLITDIWSVITVIIIADRDVVQRGIPRVVRHGTREVHQNLNTAAVYDSCSRAGLRYRNIRSNDARLR